ncbi:MAG: TonB-dependent receptor [Gammaproteobacteria bacterium]|nr:TonB-dependent receptor [Gammaproteobacteria bacterium]
MTGRCPRPAWTLALLTSGLITTAPALSQAPAGTSLSRQIEEIVVTARKREESLQDTPVAVTSFTADFAETFRLDRVEDVAEFTPGMLVSDSSGQTGTSIFLRGIGSSGTSALIDQAVAINIDGIPVNTGHIARASMFDVQQIDVLRGPQALFFGKNSPGGVLAFRTADPGEEFELELSGTYEFEADERIVRGVISAPLSDQVGVRLAAAYTKSDGHRKFVGADVPGLAFEPRPNRYPNGDSLFLRGTLLANPNEQLQIRAKFTHYEDERNRGGSALNERVACPLGVPQAFIQIDDCRADGVSFSGNLHPDVLAADPLFDPSKPEGLQDTSMQIASLELDYMLPNGFTLTSVTGYIDLDEDEQGEFGFEPANRIMRATVYGHEQISQELRLASGFEGPVNFLIGGYYEEKDAVTETAAYLAPALTEALAGVFIPLPVGSQRMTQDQRAWSVFGQLLWDITSDIEVSAGARYSRERKKVDVASFGNPVNTTADSESWSNLSPEVTATWRPRNDLMFFASYKQGFKSGGLDGSFNPAFAGPGPHELRYDEEEVEGFEAGMKSTWLDNTLRLNATAFRYRYSDLQLGNFDPDTTTLRILNVAKATILGLELEALWLPAAVDGLTLIGALNLLDTEYDDFIGDCWAGQRPDQGCDLIQIGNAFTQQDLTGERLATAAKVSGLIGFDYQRAIVPGWNMAIAANASYSGGFNASTQHSPFTIQGSYWKLNASARIMTDDGRWELALLGRNLTDKYTFTGAGATPTTGGGTGTPQGIPADTQAVVQRGRAVNLQLTYRM